MSAGVVTVSIDLPDDERGRTTVARALGNFVDRARTAGAAVVFRPSPDDVEREIAQIRADLDSAGVSDERRAPLEEQIARIEHLNHFRKLVE